MIAAALSALALTGVAASPLLLPSAAADAASRTYERTLDHSSRPVQWLACEPIQYRINPASAPKGIAAVVRRSFATVQRQTGVRFTDAGSTRRAWASSSFSHRHPTIYLSFTKKRTAKGGVHFSAQGEVGEGSIATAAAEMPKRWTFESAMYGDVILYSGFTGPRYGAGATWQSLITHEIGHTLNLEHRGSTRDLMYPTISDASPGRFSAAETTAVKRVLRTSSCRYDRFTATADAVYG